MGPELSKIHIVMALPEACRLQPAVVLHGVSEWGLFYRRDAGHWKKSSKTPGQVMCGVGGALLRVRAIF
jgi:hypothetical protein